MMMMMIRMMLRRINDGQWHSFHTERSKQWGKVIQIVMIIITVTVILLYIIVIIIIIIHIISEESNHYDPSQGCSHKMDDRSEVS